MKRFLSFLLSTAILVTSVPANVFAGGSDLNTKNSQITYTIASESDASEKKDVERPENETEGKEFNISEDVYPVNPYSDKFPEDGSYYIRNEYSMKFVAYEKEDGSVFETEYDTDEKQTWEFKRQDDESYTIEVSGGDKLYLSLKYSEKATNSDFTYSLEPVIKATDKISDSEKWFLIEEAGEGTRLVSGAVFTKEDLDKLKEGKSFKDIGKDIFALSLSKNNSNKGESYYNVGSSAENTLHITKINEDKNDEERYKQLFAITPTFLQKTDVSTLGFEEGKSYYIENTVSKKVMTADPNYYIMQNDNYKLDHQKWMIHKGGDGYYSFYLAVKPGYYINTSGHPGLEKVEGKIPDHLKWRLVYKNGGFAFEPKWAENEEYKNKEIYLSAGYYNDGKVDDKLREYSLKSRSMLYCVPTIQGDLNNYTWEFKEAENDEPDIDENKVYYIKNSYSKKVLSFQADERKLIQEDNVELPYQKWKFHKDEDGYYTISPVSEPDESIFFYSLNFWTIRDMGAYIGVSKKETNTDPEFRKWRITKTSTGTVLIGAKKCEGLLQLDCGYFNNFEVDDKLKEYAATNRSLIHQHEKHEKGFGSDEWILEEAKKEESNIEPGKVYYIKNAYSNMLLSCDHEAKIIQRQKLNLPSQRWRVNDEGDGYVSFSPESTDNKFIYVNGWNMWTLRNEEEGLYPEKKGNKMLWKIQKSKNGNYVISSKESKDRLVLACTYSDLKNKEGSLKHANEEFSRTKIIEIEQPELPVYEWQFEEVKEDKPDIEDGKEYYIVNAYNKKVVTVGGYSYIKQYENNGLEHQKWIAHKENDGYYTFSPVQDPKSRLFGGKVDKNSDEGKFKLSKTNSGNWYMSLKTSDNQLFLTSGYYNNGKLDDKLKEYINTEGSNINKELLSNNGLKNDEWYFEPVEDNRVEPNEDMIYEIQNVYSKLFISVGANNYITQEKKDESKIQQWILRKQEDGTYTISPKNNLDACIGIFSGMNFENLPVEFRGRGEGKPSDAIKWKLAKSKQGYVRIASKNSGYNQFLTAGYRNEGKVDEKLKEYAKTEGIRLGHIFDNNKEFLNDEWMLIPVEDGAGNAYHKVEFKIYGHTVYTEYVKHGGAAKGPSFAFLHKLGFIHEDELKKNASLNASLYTNENENTDLYTNEDGLAGLYKSEEFSEGEEFSFKEYRYYEPYEDYYFMTGEATASEAGEGEASNEIMESKLDSYFDNTENIPENYYEDIEKYGVYVDTGGLDKILTWDKPFTNVISNIFITGVIVSPNTTGTPTRTLKSDEWTTLKPNEKIKIEASDVSDAKIVIRAVEKSRGSLVLKKVEEKSTLKLKFTFPFTYKKVETIETTIVSYLYGTSRYKYDFNNKFEENKIYVLENVGTEDVTFIIFAKNKDRNFKVKFFARVGDEETEKLSIEKNYYDNLLFKVVQEPPVIDGCEFTGWDINGKKYHFSTEESMIEIIKDTNIYMEYKSIYATDEHHRMSREAKQILKDVELPSAAFSDYFVRDNTTKKILGIYPYYVKGDSKPGITFGYGHFVGYKEIKFQRKNGSSCQDDARLYEKYTNGIPLEHNSSRAIKESIPLPIRECDDLFKYDVDTMADDMWENLKKELKEKTDKLKFTQGQLDALLVIRYKDGSLSDELIKYLVDNYGNYPSTREQFEAAWEKDGNEARTKAVRRLFFGEE